MLSSKPISLLILSNLTKRLREADIAPEDALDQLAELDPETKLGQAMTTIMTKIANLSLFDYYLGYDRVGNVIKMYLTKEANPDNLQNLVDEIESEIEEEPNTADEMPIIIKATLYKSSDGDDDWTWILKLESLAGGPGDYDNIPVDTDISGKITVQGQGSDEEKAALQTSVPAEA